MHSATPAPRYFQITPWFAQAVVILRTDAGLGQNETQALMQKLGGPIKSQGSLSRIESGQRMPRYPDEFVSTFAQAVGVAPIDVWELAVQLWRESLDGHEGADAARHRLR